MANILINQSCNLHCCYCFTDGFASRETAADMTFEDFLTALIFNGEERIGITGGEPTIHPKFAKFLDYALEFARGHHTSVVVFTNGLEIKELSKRLTSQKLSLLINYNGPQAASQRSCKIASRNIDTLHRMGFRDSITLGINIFRPDMDLDYFIDMMKKHPANHIRASVAAPNTPELRDMGTLAYYRLMKPKALELLTRLADLGIGADFDCNKLPQCIFSVDELETVDACKKKCPDTQMISEGKCHPVIDIQPDLTAVRCVGMSEMKKISIRDIPSVADLAHMFDLCAESAARPAPSRDECLACPRCRFAICSGGCIGREAKKVTDMEPKFPKAGYPLAYHFTCHTCIHHPGRCEFGFAPCLGDCKHLECAQGVLPYRHFDTRDLQKFRCDPDGGRTMYFNGANERIVIKTTIRYEYEHGIFQDNLVEVFASALLTRLGFHALPQGLCTIDARTAGSYSNNFLQESEVFEMFETFAGLESIDSARDGVFLKLSAGERLRYVLSAYHDITGLDASEYLWQLITADLLLCNWDRNIENFGVIHNVQSDTYRAAPIFDCGHAMFIARTTYQSLDAKQCYYATSGSVFGPDFLEAYEAACDITGFTLKGRKLSLAGLPFPPTPQAYPYVKGMLRHIGVTVKD